MVIWEKTPITNFYGRPETWGVVVQTIQSGSDSFTCMDTFGHLMAVACSDDVVRIYDAVTGALRLSLRSTYPVEVVKGSPDGSVLFCAHRDNSITLWDIQTGGIIHSFVLLGRIQDIAVSLGGRYVACGFSNGIVEVLEVANKVEDAVWGCYNYLANKFCWLEPEEQLVIIGETLAQIWDVVARTILRSFTTADLISGVVYSQKLNRLATRSLFGDTIVFIDPRTGTLSAPPRVRGAISRFAFSRTTEELVCGMQGGGLRVFNLSTWHWRLLEYKDAMTFVSSLPNGVVVVGSMNSGIQSLSLDDTHAPPPQLTLALAVSTLDRGRIIAIRSPNCEYILLLETSTMSKLFEIPTGGETTGTSVNLFASLETRMVCRFEPWHTRLYQFEDKLPKWTVKGTSGSLASVGAISPTGTRLVTLHSNWGSYYVRVWDAGNGNLQAALQVCFLPSDVSFESETRFYLHYDNYHVPCDLGSPGAETTTQIIRHEEQPVESSKRQYEVDDGHEWVVRGSERICWIPPGYFRSDGGGYCWAGSDSLVMIGEDGALRRLTFRSQQH